MEYIVYDTCPTIADKMIKKLKTQMKKEKVDIEIIEVVERKKHWINCNSFKMVPANCRNINVKSHRTPARCKQCPLGLMDKGRSHSDITTIIKPLSFI